MIIDHECYYNMTDIINTIIICITSTVALYHPYTVNSAYIIIIIKPSFLPSFSRLDVCPLEEYLSTTDVTVGVDKRDDQIRYDNRSETS